MDINKYISECVDVQIKWYNKYAIRNKNYYIATKVLLTIIAAIIPALTAYIDTHTSIKIVIGILSVLTAILANISGIFKFKDNWIQYRNMCEKLNSEKYLFLHESGKYKNSEEKNQLFIETIEQSLQSENKQWLENLDNTKEI